MLTIDKRGVAMTKKQCLAKIKSMKWKQGILAECERLVRSGGIDLTSYPDDFLAPKIILTVSLKNQVFQYSPLSDPGKEEAANLSHF